jgi:hypothetical protein
MTVLCIVFAIGAGTADFRRGIMDKKKSPPSAKKKTGAEREPYEKPKIIYEGQITTAAGSPTGESPSSSGADPANVFQNTGG